MPSATRVRNNNLKNNFYGNIFGLSKEWVRSWSHASVVANLKTFPKKLLAVCPNTLTRKKGNCKAFSVTLKHKKTILSDLEWRIFLLFFILVRKTDTNYFWDVKSNPHLIRQLPCLCFDHVDTSVGKKIVSTMKPRRNSLKQHKKSSAEEHQEGKDFEEII